MTRKKGRHTRRIADTQWGAGAGAGAGAGGDVDWDREVLRQTKARGAQQSTLSSKNN